MTAIIVDTSAILAIFDESYAEHPAIARALADSEDLLVVSPMVAAEADCMLASRLGPKAARRIAADIAEDAYELAEWTSSDHAAALAVIDGKIVLEPSRGETLMSYPAAKYLGESGEVSAQLRPASVAPELRRKTGSVSYLATGATTGGQFGLYHWDFGNEGGGPGPHFHRTMTESFYILAGTVRVYDGTRWVDATRGDYLYVPEGGIHGFEGVAGTNAEMLILFTPGAPREAYFEGLAAGLDGKTPAERAAFFADHDNHWI